MFLWAFVVGSLFLNCARSQLYSAICEDSGTAGSFDVIFKYDRDGTTTATGLESYDASESNFETIISGAGCSTTTLTDDIYTISYTVNTANQLPCGIQQDAVDTSVYKFAISPTGIDKVYTFSCDTDALQIPTTVIENNFYTEHLDQMVTIVQNENDVSFQVVSADRYHAIVEEVSLGQPIRLRLTFDNGLFDRQPNMCGTSFHLSSTTATTTSLEIFTKGLGALVRITGSKSGDEFEVKRYVKRETPVVYEIPTSYTPAGSLSDWPKFNGIKIESLSDAVCVRVKTSSPYGMYTALPDHFLGTSYRVADYNSRGDAESDFYITAAEDGTDVTLDISSYISYGTPLINGSPGTSTTTVQLDATESLHMTCSDCSCITITSTKNIALVNAAVIPDASAPGFAMSPIPDIKYLDTEFVISPTPNLVETDVILTLEAVGDSSTYSTVTDSGQAISDVLVLSESGERLSTNDHVYAFQVLSEMSCSSPAFLLTGRRQWSTHYDLDVLLDSDEDLFVDVIAETGEFGNNIYIRSNTADILLTGTGPTPYASFSGEPHPSAPVYELHRASISNNGHYVIYSKDVTKAFYLHIVQRKENGPIDLCTGYLPFGISFTQINPCTANNHPMAGNQMDDDCDTLIDEEFPDGIDNDGDGEVDEDLAILEDNLAIGIVVDSLIVADNDGFIGDNVVTVHQSGCNIIAVGDPHATISEFKKYDEGDGLSSVFKDLVVMQTDDFRAYRFSGSDYVYFRVNFEWCFNDCDTSCLTEKRKRSTHDLHHVDLKLNVNSTRYSDSKGARAWRCTAAKVYWIPHMLLVIIIMIEVITTCYFLYVKMNRKGD